MASNSLFVNTKKNVNINNNMNNIDDDNNTIPNVEVFSIRGGGSGSNDNNDDDDVGKNNKSKKSKSFLQQQMPFSSPRAMSCIYMAVAMALHFGGYEFARSGALALFTSSNTGFSHPAAYPFGTSYIQLYFFVFERKRIFFLNIYLTFLFLSLSLSLSLVLLSYYCTV